MAKKTLLDDIIESIKGIDGRLINQSGTTKQMISDLNYKVVAPAKSAADSAVSAADAAVASAQVTSYAVSAIASATAEAKQGANEAMSRALSAWNVATGAKSAVTDFDPLLKSAQSDAGKALTQIADTASALSDAKTAFGSDVATAKQLANTAQTTADSAVAVASDARSNATVAIQTASGASLTAINAQSDATIAKQTASEATVQASNAESDFAQISIRANKIEANVATNSGAIASVQQTANGLTTTVADIKANGGGVNLVGNSGAEFSGKAYSFHDYSFANSNALTPGKTYTVSFSAKVDDKAVNCQQFLFVDVYNSSLNWWVTARSPISTDYQRVTNTFTVPEGVTDVSGITAYLSHPVINDKEDGSSDKSDVAGTGYIEDLMLEEGTVAHTWSPAPDDLQNQFTQIKQSINGVKTTINDPKTGLNATYQTAAGNSSTISSVKGDVTQLQSTANGLTSRVGNLESKTDKQQTTIDQNKNAITLKADQTTVNTLKGNVDQNTATLKTQAGQIQSKVSASDVTGMLSGYATQSYTQSLVTQTADKWNMNLTNLQTDVNAIKTTGGGVNLVSGTTEDIVVDDTANTGTQGWRFNTVPINADLQVGDKITVSVENVTITGKGDLSKWGATLYTPDLSEMRANNYEVNAGKNAQVTITVTSINDPNKQTALLIYPGRVGDTEGKKAVFHHLMVEEGTVAHTWSPAPSDLASVKSVTNLSATVDGIQSQVYNSDGSSKITQLSSAIMAKVSQGDYNSQITILKNDINQRVQVGDLISQINLQAGASLIQSSKLVLDSGTTVFTGDAFIPDAAISEINTDKLFFSDSNGNKSFMSTNLGALDPMAPANSLSIRYKTGYEVTTSDRGVFFMMGQNYTRYAVRSKYSDKFSGIWASDTEAYFIEEGQGLHLWAPDKDQSAWALYNSNNVGIRASLANTNAIDVGRVDDGYAYNTKMDTSPTAIAFYINGWEWVAGYVEAMGTTQHSVLSSKTRIEQADPDHMLDLINNTELTTFAYKSELADGTDHRHIGPIIDDINDVAQYQIPSEFVAPTKTARDDGNIVGALIGSVQALIKRIKKLEDKLNG